MAAANDLALLKAVGKFSPLPIAASRSMPLGGTVARVGFYDSFAVEAAVNDLYRGVRCRCRKIKFLR